MSSPIMQAIKQISEEKDIPYEAIVETIEAALASAYRKDFGDKEKQQNIKVKFEAETGAFEVFDVKTVVEDQELPTEEELAAAAEAARLAAEAKAKEREEALAAGKELPPEEPVVEEKRFNPKTEIMITEARASLKKDAEIGEEIWTKLEVPAAFGRMAAQTAKQVITQRLREAERSKLYNEFKDREHELLNATIQRQEGRIVLVDVGRAAAVMPPEEQIPGEKYLPGNRIKVYVSAVRLTTRGPEVVVSRAHPDIIKKLFNLEIPEVAAGTVEIKAIAREAGSRSKVAVSSNQENVDPIGACIGQRGTRIQTVIGELGGEKVDIILWDEDPVKFITNALSPAKVMEIALDEEAHIAEVIVNEDQLSLAIGRGGQNVRLASKLTGWRINIKELSEVSGAVLAPPSEEIPGGTTPLPEPDVAKEEQEIAAIETDAENGEAAEQAEESEEKSS